MTLPFIPRYQDHCHSDVGSGEPPRQAYEPDPAPLAVMALRHTLQLTRLAPLAFRHGLSSVGRSAGLLTPPSTPTTTTPPHGRYLDTKA